MFSSPVFGMVNLSCLVNFLRRDELSYLIRFVDWITQYVCFFFLFCVY